MYALAVEKIVSLMNSPLGVIEIIADEENVYSILFIDHEERIEEDKLIASDNRLTRKCKQQLSEYFSNSRTSFDLDLHLSGSQFQNDVWKELQKIPFGKTRSYMQMAKALGDPKCIRAAASANGKNPFAIVVPCHRVVGSNSDLIGYAGGLWRKRWLLEHESRQQSLF